MLVSAFTPTHDPTYLADVYACLQEQTHKDWEWVVVPNGKSMGQICALLQKWADQDSRVKIFPYPKDQPAGNIGALKKYACDNAKGDLYLEYDHDDIITPDCFETVVAAAIKAGPLAFIFSEDVTLNEDGTSVRYGSDWGWRHYPWTFRGRTHYVNRRFTVQPRTLCEILYSPDHVRVWTKEAYKKTGGHNAALIVGDDHELMVRTYLAGVEYVPIDRSLYIHRLRKNNTSVPRTKEIQKVSRATRDKYLFDLVTEWCKRESLPMYDLGGAHNCPPNYVPVDKALPEGVAGLKQDVFEFLNTCKPNTVGCIRAADFLEHLPSTAIPEFMNKVYDALVPGGWLLSHTPAVCDDAGRCGRGAWQDPTHLSGWSTNNFWYYTNSQYAKYVPEIRCRFQAVVLKNYYPSDWHNTHLIPYVRADLCALKDANDHWPGPKHI